MDSRSISSPHRVPSGSRPRGPLLGLALVLGAGAFAGAAPAAEPARSIRSAGHSPSSLAADTVDPACAWGRLSDGKGKLLRCLTRDEAGALRDAARPTAAPPAAPTSPLAAATAPPPATPVRTSLSWPLPAAPAAAAVAPLSVAVGNAPVAPGPAAPSPLPPVEADPVAPPAESALSVEVGPVVADEGALPDANKNLRKPRDRYVECVDRNGGLTADRGEVELRFLVQGKGRAEGVSVKMRRGVGAAAAKCMADIVDRRYVGYPEAPAVGASVVVTITKKKR